MDTGDKRRGSTQDSDRAFQRWEAHLQDYVDGTLDEKLALRMHLDAQKNASLQRAIDETRDFFQALDAAPLARPSEDFDERILAAIPLEYYVSAPRRSPRRILLGDPEESLAMRAWGWLGRGATALLALHLLVVVIGRSPAAGGVSTVGGWIGTGLTSFADAVGNVAVLSAVASGLESGYAALQSLARATVANPLDIVWPLTLLAVMALTGLARRLQHQREISRMAAGHSAE